MVLETVYGHLSKILVGVNDIVTRWRSDRFRGNTGRSTDLILLETGFLG